MNEVKKEPKEKKQGDSWDSVKGFAIWLGTYGWIFLLITEEKTSSGNPLRYA